MSTLNVFVSVGGTCTAEQEEFVKAVEDRLRSEGLIPHTVGRNTFSVDTPLKTVTEYMDKCSGTVVIALERVYFPAGLERRGGSAETALVDVRLPTPWNQIEAAMAYSRNHPLLVIVENGLRSEGLLERGNDWYVQTVKPEAAALSTTEFNGVLASWKRKIQTSCASPAVTKSPTEMTVKELLGGLKTTQLWGVVSTLFALVAGSFALGAKLFTT